MPLISSTSKEIEKAAKKSVEIVIQAILNLFAQGDVTIAGFGTLHASKDSKGNARVTFSAADKLVKAAQARLTTPTPPPDPPKPVDPPPTPVDPPPIATNFALDKPVVASGHLTANEPNKMVDGNPRSEWVSGHLCPAWAVVDLGAQCRIRRVAVRMGEDPCAFKINYTAGGPFQQLAEYPMGPHPFEALDIDIEATHIQIVVEQSAAQLGWAHVFELWAEAEELPS